MMPPPLHTRGTVQTPASSASSELFADEQTRRPDSRRVLSCTTKRAEAIATALLTVTLRHRHPQRQKHERPEKQNNKDDDPHQHQRLLLQHIDLVDPRDPATELQRCMRSR